MKKALFFFLTVISFPSWSQNVQWAYKILDFSSEKSSDEFSAVQALGIPNSEPSGVQNIRAWEPKGNHEEEFIKVGFLNPIVPKQIVVAESFHPGYISKIYVYDSEGKEYQVASYIPKGVSTPGRFLQVNTNLVHFYVFAVKIVLNGKKNIPIGIDAIGISESDAPFKMKKNANDVVKMNMVAVKLDSNINSKYAQIGPLVSPDGQTLYFSRRGDPNDMGGKKDEEDIWYAKWNAKDNHWDKAQNFGPPLNNNYPNFINSISPDGNTILLGNSYNTDGTMQDGVSTSKRTLTGWSAPMRLIIEDDEENKSKLANYFMSNSQKILLISNDRRGDSYGDRDLYVSFYKTDSTWTKPLNLGKTINTKGTEAAPFLASDDKTLYYTSDGLGGYGGSDIYMSRRLDNSWTKWSEPENLGPVVNTSFDESFFTLNASANKVYFTSQRSKGKNDMDIYMLELLPKIFKPIPVMLLRGQVINSKTNAFIPSVKIIFENLATGVEEGIASSSPDSGRYQMVLPSGSIYGYLAIKPGFISVNAHVNLENMNNFQELYQNIYLTPIEVGQTAVINNVFFDFDKYVLKKESFPELNRLAGLLKSNASMKIEVSGNTDNVGTEEYNDQLSINRATAVVNYLIAKSDADANRISMKHYGATRPVASNATAPGRQLNRRVQFKILAK